MQPFQDASVYIVEDDASVRDALAWLLRSRRWPSMAFNSAEAFITAVGNGLALSQPTCLLLDVRMPGKSGLELFDWLAAHDLHEMVAVIFLTGHADVPTAVAAVKRGAFDFCEKPFSDNALVDRIEQALIRSRLAIEASVARTGVEQRLSDLTDRERHVMRLVVQGLPNKLIADQLAISVRTVEVHRARVFEKMDIKSAVELANLLRESRQL
jgi:two-component system, LuxR family, response regulator DctR